MKYKIYHIPDYVYSDGSVGKIGTTCQIKRRMKANLKKSMFHFDYWEIIEEHNDKYKASVREIELQKQYGYKEDTIQYHSTIEMSSKGGKATTGSFNYWDKKKHLQAAYKGHAGLMARGDWKDLYKKSRQTFKSNGKTRGSKNHRSVFSDQDICDIKNEWNSTDINIRDLAIKYNVVNSVMSNIIRNKTYQDVGPVCIPKRTVKGKQILTPQIVRYCREQHSRGKYSIARIARAFYVEPATMSYAINRKTFKDI